MTTYGDSILRIAAALAAAAVLALIAAACGTGGGGSSDDSTPPDSTMPAMPPPAEQPEPETPRVTAALSAAEVEENGSATLTLTADADLPAAAAFNLSATQGVTFGEGAQSESEIELTIAAGQRSATVSVSAPDIADVTVARLDSVISIAAASGAEVEFPDAMLPLAVSNPLPSGPPPTVEVEISDDVIPEGGRATITVTAAAPLAETVTFLLRPAPGVSFEQGRRAIQILPRMSSGSIELIGGMVPGNANTAVDVGIQITTDSEAVEFTSGMVSLFVENVHEFMLAEPVLDEDGSMVTLRLEASYAVERQVAVVIDLPKGVFSEDTTTLRIAAGGTAGVLQLDIEDAPESGERLEFAIRSGSFRGIENYRVTEDHHTIVFRR